MKYPGKISDKAMEDWFSNAASKAGFVPLLEGSAYSNPCIRLYGRGPENEKCRNCRLLFRHRMAKTYFKCELRGFTHGPATDHRANWPVCGRFVKI